MPQSIPALVEQLQLETTFRSNRYIGTFCVLFLSLIAGVGFAVLFSAVPCIRGGSWQRLAAEEAGNSLGVSEAEVGITSKSKLFHPAYLHDTTLVTANLMGIPSFGLKLLPGPRFQRKLATPKATVAVQHGRLHDGHPALRAQAGGMLTARERLVADSILRRSGLHPSAGSSPNGIQVLALPRSTDDSNVDTSFFSALRRLNVDGFKKAVDEQLLDFAIGRRERRWQKDYRPESERGIAAGPSEKSQLMWGGANSLAIYEEKAEQLQIATSGDESVRMQNQAVGSAAVAIFGESAKGNPELDAKLGEACRFAQVPLRPEDACNLNGPVELAELIQGKYGRYYDAAIQRINGRVAFKLYSAYLGQKAFPYTEEQWLQKLDSIVILLSDLNQAWYVRRFLLSKGTLSKSGLYSLPSKPTPVYAPTLFLSNSPTWEEPRDRDVVDAWFALQSLR